MFNQLKKRGNNLTEPVSEACKRKAYLYKKRQLLLAQQRRMLIERENLRRQQLSLQNPKKIQLQQTLINKFNQIYNDINKGKIQYNSLNLNICDKANWSEHNKKQMNFLENRINNYDENHNYIYDFSNDIIIYASYPKDYSFIYMINKFLSYNFKKIYFVYSNTDFMDSNFKDIPLLNNNNNIVLINVDNIGNDFKKYYEGIKKVKENKDEYDKVWLINDSFLITKWNFFIYNLKRVGNKEIIGAFLSNEIKKHLQSYLLIMNNNILDIYYNFLKKYNFKKIVTHYDKRKLIIDLEINLCNDNLKEDNYGVLFGLNNNLNINFSNINPTTSFGFYCGILKKEIINFSSIDLLKLNSNEFLFIFVYILLFKKKNYFKGSKIEKFKKEILL